MGFTSNTLDNGCAKRNHSFLVHYCNYRTEYSLQDITSAKQIYFECINIKINKMLSSIQNRQLVHVKQDKCPLFSLNDEYPFHFLSQIFL